MNVDNIIRQLTENAHPLKPATTFQVGDIFVIPYSHENPSIEPYQIIKATDQQLVLSLIELHEVKLNVFKPVKNAFLEGRYAHTVTIDRPEKSRTDYVVISGLNAYRHYDITTYSMGI